MVATAVSTHLPVPHGRPVEAAVGTRVNTAKLLCAALREAASGLARQAAVPAPPEGLCMPLAVLWSRSVKFDAADARWPDRDRFILSTEAATPLLHGLLHLTGHATSGTAPLHPALEAAGAPGGQAIAMAVGMALAERVLAARFGKSLVDHRVWAVCDASELTQGVTHEAAALAGYYRLDRLVLLADASAPGLEDARPRFLTHGWAVKSVAAEDPEDIEAALSFAARSRKPTLLWCAPSAADPCALVRPNANALEAWRRVGARGALARRAWLKRMARHAQRAEFERVHAGRLPDALHEAIACFREQLGHGHHAPAPPELCRQLIDRLAQTAPEVLCGRLDGNSSAAGQVQPGQYGGRTIAYGKRPLGSAACTNGIALHGGALPVTASALIDLVEQLPALRMAAMLGRRMLHVAFDSASGWQPVELLAWLRAIPELLVFRPGCAAETAECMELALRRADGPSLVMVGANRPAPPRADPRINLSARGGYVLAEAAGTRGASLIAAGPAVAPALAARQTLAAAGIDAAVVSLPCWTLFGKQDDAYQRAVLGAAPRFGVEAGCRGGWDRWLNDSGGFIGQDITADGVAQAVRRRLVRQG